MAESRLIGGYPVIGIRPTIDGRRGALKVRESLEEQTMGMAKLAAKLFEENLTYSNGEPVKVVIADTTIGRVAESAACEEKFRKEGVDITLTVTPCWCYGSETMDMNPQTIKGVWGLNATERPGAVYLASVLATHTQKGLPAFGIYGHDVVDADDMEMGEDVREKLLRFGRAAIAAASMRGKSYLQIGSICMGIGGSIIDSDFIESYLGMRVESVDEVEIIRRMTEEIYDKEEVKKALDWAKEKCTIGFDKNPDELKMSDKEKEEQFEFVVKMAVIIKDLMNGNKNLPEGCEEEAVGHNADAVKRVTGYEIEGKAKEANGFIHLINSGAACLDASGESVDSNGNHIMKKWYDVTDKDQDAMLNATTWNAADNGYFRGGGFSSRFLTKAEMPVTMIRLNLIKGLGPVLQIVEGWTLNLPEEVSEQLWKRTDYTWPCTWFVPRCTGKGAFKTAYDVMNNWGANHGAISYGHIGADLITMASMLRIPVSMHNVPEEKIFRPAAWNAFGQDKEGQDYRACAAYGPLYK